MADSESVVTEASAHSAAETYASAGYAESGSNPALEAGTTVDEPAGEGAQSTSTYEYGYSNTGDVNAYTGDPNSVLQQAQFNATGDTKPAGGLPDANEASAAVGSTAAEPALVSDYSSSVNGGVVGAVANSAGLENGNALENVDGSADEKQLADGYGVDFFFMLSIYFMNFVVSVFTFFLVRKALNVKLGRTIWCIITSKR